MNNREVKNLNFYIKDYYGSVLSKNYLFLQKKDGKVFILSKPLPDETVFRLYINNIGLYLGKFEFNDFRLSIEGSQLLKPVKHVIELLDIKQVNDWMQGLNIELNIQLKKGYYAVRHGSDYFGTGHYKEGILRNFVSKGRRLALKNLLE